MRVAEGKKRGVDPYGILTEMVRNIPIGCDGAVALDCFRGNRSPYTGPPARTIFWGLSMNHGPGHVCRPIIERICYGTDLIFPTVQEHDSNPRVNVVPAAQLRAACGYRFTPTFRTFRSPLGRCSRAPVLGAAICAYRGRRDVPRYPRGRRGDGQDQAHDQAEPERHEEYQFYVVATSSPTSS
jgi:hypothetical protein